MPAANAKCEPISGQFRSFKKLEPLIAEDHGSLAHRSVQLLANLNLNFPTSSTRGQSSCSSPTVDKHAVPGACGVLSYPQLPPIHGEKLSCLSRRHDIMDNSSRLLELRVRPVPHMHIWEWECLFRHSGSCCCSSAVKHDGPRGGGLGVTCKVGKQVPAESLARTGFQAPGF